MIMQHCGHLERTRSAPRGRTAADGADIPPGHSTGLDLYQARKKGRAWAGPGCAFFPFPGRLPGSPPPPFFPGVAFRGFGAPPPVVWLGFAPRDLAPGSSGS